MVHPAPIPWFALFSLLKVGKISIVAVVSRVIGRAQAGIFINCVELSKLSVLGHETFCITVLSEFILFLKALHADMSQHTEVSLKFFILKLVELEKFVFLLDLEEMLANTVRHLKG